MKNTYILMIVQALLTLLLFFAQGPMQYATMGLILLFDLVLFLTLFSGRWKQEEFLTFAAVICSGLFVLFYMTARNTMTDIFGALIVVLFVVLAILSRIADEPKTAGIKQPKPPVYHYDIKPYYEEKSDKKEGIQKESAVQKPYDGKIVAKADAYELEREAKQLRDAEKLIKDLEIYNAEKKLLDESAKLQDAQKKIDIVNKAVKDANKAKKAAKELKKETEEIIKVQKQISDISKLKQLEKEAQQMKKAEKQIKEIKFLNQQEKMVKQAKAIAKAQKDIDELKQRKQKPQTVKVKTVKAKDETFYFSTETGNKFHEPGCIAIKNVPKNKLTLFTSKKDALKKGLQPCSVCIPK